MGGRHQMRDMKDGLNRKAVRRLAGNLERAFPRFDLEGFVAEACDGLEALELKARVKHIAKVMESFAPTSPKTSIEGLLGAVPNWDRGDANDNLRGFASWPVFDFVEAIGAPVWEMALRALGELSHLFTAEFSVRPLIENNTEKAMVVVDEWTRHESEHVRRLASEGIRPRLPWASKLPCFIDDPKPVIGILDALVDDDELYVRRSVANCLSDIAADHPDVAIATCERWLEIPTENRRWVAKRATRNLIKSGHPKVWGLHGFTAEPAVEVGSLYIDSQEVALDQPFSLSFELISKAEVDQRLVVDFVVHHVKAGGGTSAKVFKLSEVLLEAGKAVHLSKKHAFRNITTRRYYPGAHRIEIQVNGARYAGSSVMLEM